MAKKHHIDSNRKNISLFTASNKTSQASHIQFPDDTHMECYLHPRHKEWGNLFEDRCLSVLLMQYHAITKTPHVIASANGTTIHFMWPLSMSGSCQCHILNHCPMVSIHSTASLLPEHSSEQQPCKVTDFVIYCLYHRGTVRVFDGICPKDA